MLSDWTELNWTMVEVMKITVCSFKKVPCRHCCMQCPLKPAAGHCLCSETHASAGDSWTLTCKSGSVSVESLLLSPGSWCPQAFICALQESISQSSISSGSSMVRLMVTSSKRAYAIPVSCTQSPCPCSSPLLFCTSAGDTQTQLSQSLWGLWVLVRTRLVWALWASLSGKGFDSKCNFAPPTILLGLLRCQLDVGYHLKVA